MQQERLIKNSSQLKHVSGNYFAHLQEHWSVCYSLWYNAPIGQQHCGCIIPQAVTHSLVLLKMGKIIA